MKHTVLALVATVALALAAPACTADDDPSSNQPVGQANPQPAPQPTNAGADQAPGSEDLAPTGEPRGTVTIGGESHQVALSDIPAATCQLTPEFVVVVDMVSPDGIQLHTGYVPIAEIWQATLHVSGPPTWLAGTEAAAPGNDVTFEPGDGRLVISGTWVAADGSGATQDVRVDLACPGTLSAG
ncbi:hypothetical protein [Nocardioides sp. AE5]|uniref:hypothetical protein n=1 Tax=Nocardioides sp. AE5 TaxID=2962573 RepID=UPI0028813016|nr:hypothetical protein [Nocardioides sp. AE5]MDT0203088.1 hypothetical protein [Nocardioides sp. AE5]